MEITQRNATLDDAAVLLTWRNSPSAREFSQHSELIPVDEHFKWFSNRLQRVPTEPFLIFAVDHELIGVSRLDIVGGSTKKFEISILLDPNLRGKGLGTRVLNITCESFFNLHPDRTIVAKVHKHNFISQKLFSKAGFQLRASEGEFLHFEKSLD